MRVNSILLAALGATAASAHAIPPERFGCGTSEPSAEHLQTNKALATQEMQARLAGTLSSMAAINVDIYFHVVAASTKLTDGYVTDKMLSDQFKVVSDNYAPYGITFTLKNITRTINSQWASIPMGSELPMKKALRKGDYKTLNVYFQKTMGGSTLGYATFPEAVQPNTAKFWKDGVVIKYNTLPGGTATGFNLGKTVTHEAGHWFGLFHTFQGGCTTQNDGVSDTPAQGEPTSGCPTGKDTCPRIAGVDPIHNYMDYSSDACYEEFTPGQSARMNSWWVNFRA